MLCLSVCGNKHILFDPLPWSYSVIWLDTYVSCYIVRIPILAVIIERESKGPLMFCVYCMLWILLLTKNESRVWSYFALCYYFNQSLLIKVTRGET